MKKEITVKIAEGDELQSCYAIRREVFVDEQKVPLETEIDEYDADALHFIAIQDTKPIATARVVFKDAGKTAKIGRVAVIKSARGSGIGKYLMQAIEQDKNLNKAECLVLEAQTHALSFYQKLGYQAHGEEYLDANIPHFYMQKTRPR